MELIKDWAVLLCVSSVTSGIIVFLIPDGKLRKTANIVISLFMLSVFTSIFSSFNMPVIDNKSNIEPDIENYSSNVDDLLVAQSRKTSEEIINDCLDKICMFSYKTKTDWKINNNEISLTHITVTISNGDYSRINLIKTKVGSLTGIIPKVITQ